MSVLSSYSAPSPIFHLSNTFIVSLPPSLHMRHPLCSVIYSVWPLPHMELLFQLTWPVTLHLSPVHLLELSEHVAPTFIATWRWISSVLGGCWAVYHIYHKLQGTLCHMHHLRRKTCSIFSGRESYCRENQQLVRSAGMKTLLPRLDFIGKWWEEAVRIINKRIKLIIFAGSNLFLSSSFLRCCVLREASCYRSSWTRVSAACCVTFNTL